MIFASHLWIRYVKGLGFDSPLIQQGLFFLGMCKSAFLLSIVHAHLLLLLGLSILLVQETVCAQLPDAYRTH